MTWEPPMSSGTAGLSGLGLPEVDTDLEEMTQIDGWWDCGTNSTSVWLRKFFLKEKSKRLVGLTNAVV